jgi:DNA polymerase III subunit epsilon
MRQIMLDTETTGLSAEKGHRVVEIGCIELVERRPTGRRFQRYLNPQRPMDAGATEVTGLTDDFLADKPLFADIAEEFIAFIAGAELVIHNAAFDVGFLDAELARTGRGYASIREMCGVVDSLQLARERFPGQRNSLDALCRRLQVDNGHRTLHGALLDAELLTEVYLGLTAGQGDLGFDAPAATVAQSGEDSASIRSTAPPVARPKVRRASADELQRHDARLQRMAQAGRCLWQASDPSHSEHPVVA